MNYITYIDNININGYSSFFICNIVNSPTSVHTHRETHAYMDVWMDALLEG